MKLIGIPCKIGGTSYILLFGRSLFLEQTESEIFKAILKADASSDETPWPSLSSGAVDLVKRLLIKDSY